MPSTSTRSRARSGVLTVVAAVLALAVAACGGGGQPSASSIVSRSAAETAKQTSFHVVVSIQHAAVAKTGMSLTFVDGDLVVPDRLKARIGGMYQGVPLQSELVVVGDKQYLKDPFSGQWRTISLGLSPVAFFDPAKGVLAVIKGARDVSVVGSETVDGVDCYRLSAKVSADTLRPLLGNPSSARLLPVELWIGKRDSLLRRIRLSGAVVPSESAQATRIVELSRFGEHVTIVAPAGAG